ncbi:hypothetical protein D477_010052 [Arthrobacter crystallopoietes BAB-32]|uniref:Beta-lactamase class A catalytic domain-containing protein n=1 Tax=Arthrobacter crystallopoietes BAB-32 TaxID=1246476 RepID=N1V7Z7_9MICC|nr:serine hydrolase [Arthrobacter crystallopoietes]EMY34358.1 hypothetical protein D477_010052 [Arthrobacter crystallopoietes BAB-32]
MPRRTVRLAAGAMTAVAAAALTVSALSFADDGGSRDLLHALPEHGLALAGPAPAERTAPGGSGSREERFQAAMAEHAAVTGKTFSVAVRDGETGQTWTYERDRRYMEASIVKVSIVLTLIRQATEDGRGLTGEELELAGLMIRESDNEATNELYIRIGGEVGLEETYRLLGMAGTEAGAGWGASLTTAEDQLKVVDAVVYGAEWLDEEQRNYLLELMNSVEGSQYWGVPAGTDDAAVALKNGWLQDDQGRWNVNSIGHVSEGANEYSIAVLSNGSPAKDDGVDLVEDVAAIVHDL